MTLGLAIPTHSSVPKVWQLGEMITMLSSASPDIASVAARELADAYRRCLEEIQNTFRSWKQISVSLWTNAHWSSFYDYVRASLFPSATISNRYGRPVLLWGNRDLGATRIAVDDFLEYGGVYLETEENAVSIQLDVLEHDDSEQTKAVRADLIRFLQNAADIAQLQLVFPRPRIGANMTLATLAGGYLTTKGSGTLDWNYASGMLQRLDALVEDAVGRFRSHNRT
jgi:hypothetical protein